jgi:hypothetical protein
MNLTAVRRRLGLPTQCDTAVASSLRLTSTKLRHREPMDQQTGGVLDDAARKPIAGLHDLLGLKSFS